MPILTDAMKALVRDHTLGFVATVNADGTPNLSPKGTMAVIDDDRIGFGEIRSPGTRTNIATRPAVELNFVDVFARKGWRFRGKAVFHAKNTAEYKRLLPTFAKWEDLHNRFNGIVAVTVERALSIVSPAYDRGISEAELKASFKAHFMALLD
ncbi:MAG: pyridoxamine 5'-phosphate oxidase family protein [Rhodospirillales bacterium]|nr:pyridoxamine 5'-phosphate oxidase family protein [Rhodospirillales bacterium]